MKIYAAILLGGALGSLARFGLVSWVDSRADSAFPWGTLLVNVTGSFVIGLIAGLVGPNSPLATPLSEEAVAFLLIGICGGFTTFSAFSLQNIVLLQNGQWALSAAYTVGSVLVCLVGTAAGMALVAAWAARS